MELRTKVILGGLIIGLACSVSATNHLTPKTQQSPAPLSAHQTDIPRVPKKPIATYTSEDIAQALNWQWSRGANRCDGFYVTPGAIAQKIPQGSIKKQLTRITANRSMLLTQSGTSILKGDVTAIQPGRLVMAQQAYVDRNPKTYEVTRVRLKGAVAGYESDNSFIANEATMNVKKNTLTLCDMLYRYHKAHSTTGPYDAWGHAEKAFKTPDGNVRMNHVTYSTCQPGQGPWHIYAKKLYLNRQTGRGTVTHAVLMVKHVPVFYLPYFNFPIDRRRKTGFLYPTVSRSSRNGFIITTPFYLNLAPNYDATITPQRISRRHGIKLNNQFRYLTHHHRGMAVFNIIHHDDAFTQFRREHVVHGGDVTNPAFRHLLHASSNRYIIHLRNNSQFGAHWSAHQHVNYVSDDYYLQDFKEGLPGASKTQLFNQATLTYRNGHWDNHLNVDVHQSLHPVNISKIQDKYNRLPELDINAGYPLFYGVGLQWKNQLVYFDHNQQFGNFPTGLRGYSSAELSWAYNKPAGYIKPAVKLSAVGYRLFSPFEIKKKTLGSVVPGFRVDSGLNFIRHWPWSRTPYQQTLEPRLFYVYIPFVSQEDQPNFDTSSPSLSYHRLFHMNRFSGFDRVGDANLVTYALTTRLIDPFSGNEKFKANVAQQFQFKFPKLCLNRRCPKTFPRKSHFSSLSAGLSYNVTPHLSTSASASYNPTIEEIVNANLNIGYHAKNNRIMSLKYHWVRQKNTKNLKLLDLGFAWPLLRKWHVFAHTHYDVTRAIVHDYFYGIEYYGCCWSFRVVVSRTLLGVNKHHPFDQDTAFQIRLRGLGTYQKRDYHKMLTKGIPGFSDIFSN